MKDVDGYIGFGFNELIYLRREKRMRECSMCICLDEVFGNSFLGWTYFNFRGKEGRREGESERVKESERKRERKRKKKRERERWNIETYMGHIQFSA